jgi:DNA-binding LacI/PurR family transcriptional regulator/DNA-binding CsgD family transcriptional regulator
MKDKQILVLIQPTGINDYWMRRLLEGISEESERRKFRFVSACFSPHENTEKLAENGQMILLAGTKTEWLLSSSDYVLRIGGYPIFVNACIPPIPDSMPGSCVCFSLERAVIDCIEYLEKMGKKQPALIGLNPSSDADHKKAEIFQTVMKEKGIEPVFVFCSEAGLEESIADIAQTALKNGTDGFICANDTAAIFTISCLREDGIPVGVETPVIGMGNSYLGIHSDPPLTTVDFDYYSLGAEAVRLYEFLCRDIRGADVRLRLPANLVVRDSTGGIPFQRRDNSDHFLDGNQPEYFSGNRVRSLIMLENELQTCDKTDREIIFSVANGATYEQISERLFLSERTVKYRLSHILGRLNLHGKAELCNLVREVLKTSD